MLVEYSPPYDTAAHSYHARTIFQHSGGDNTVSGLVGDTNRRLSVYRLSLVAEYAPLIPTTVAASHHVSGSVLSQDGTPISRRVAAFSRSTMALLGESVSDPVTGEYTIELGQSEPCFVVCLPDPEETINAKIFDKIQPLPI